MKAEFIYWLFAPVFLTIGGCYIHPMDVLIPIILYFVGRHQSSTIL